MTVIGNGIFILKTKHSSDGLEYRVSYSDDIGVIYSNFNDNTDHWDIDPIKLRETFQHSRVYTYMAGAIEYATDQMRFLNIETECGIMVISTEQSKTWAELIQLDIPKK